ncbi:MAG TPA: replication factor C large subunit [Candidatus Aenigmarchaeota archaeon]|nr:replication factor C large subunit [Candidatus Aenigmarchaeota archaeon]HEX32923.1 replication factor C large subunit [Candidatus Aenigmarchaeota archaeon]
MLLLKYRPRTVKDIVGQQSAVSKLVFAVRHHKPGKGIFLYGPTGVGKTSSVYALANDLGYEVVNMDASDLRSADQINKIIGSSSRQASLFGKGKILLIDELEGFSRNDRGGISAVVKVIKQSRFPVVVIANDVWNRKFYPLKQVCTTIEFRRLNKLTVKAFLSRVVKRERLNVSAEQIEKISESCNGDLRAALLDLDLIARGYKEDIIRLTERSVFDALKNVFRAENPFDAKVAFDRISLDYSQMLLWVGDNVPIEYRDIEEVSTAMNFVSRADVFLGRVVRRQYWRFLDYVYLLGLVGVAASRARVHKGFRRYVRPVKLVKLGSTRFSRAADKEIAERFAMFCHTSVRHAMSYVYMYNHIKSKSKKKAEELLRNIS